AATAVLLVLAGVAMLGWSRQRMVGLAEDLFAPLSYGAIGLVGLWLLVRGARRLLAVGARADHGHAQDHGHAHAHGACTHRHGPDAAEAAGVRSLGDALVLIGSIAIRPCTGALFLLIVTWRMEILPAGIAGTFAMGLGTASVTVAVALAAVGFRAGAWASVGEGRALRWGMPVLECLAGGAVLLAAAGLLSRALAA
ncbi:nickel/cobalt transporter, partial [Oceaniglobus roseus]|uniref:nickel/cobalt transporter n=1 Tax=Oceaniglobus roseus TaxID=1737570 RepID=UPI003CCBF2AE